VALLASQSTGFQAMTKAQIVDYCSAVHGVELDASQTKAELIEQAMALEVQANDTAAADLAALELGDALL
jgi:sensor domain CHASE-containing protein